MEEQQVNPPPPPEASDIVDDLPTNPATTDAALQNTESAPVPELPELNTTAPELNTPASELNTAAPELNTPAPELNAPAPDLNTSAPDMSISAPDLNTSAPELNTPAPPPPDDHIPPPDDNHALPELDTDAPSLDDLDKDVPSLQDLADKDESLESSDQIASKLADPELFDDEASENGDANPADPDINPDDTDKSELDKSDSVLAEEDTSKDDSTLMSPLKELQSIEEPNLDEENEVVKDGGTGADETNAPSETNAPAPEPIVIAPTTQTVTSIPIKPMVVIESAKVISCVMCNKYTTTETNKRIYKLNGTKAVKAKLTNLIELFTGHSIEKLLLEHMHVCDPCVKIIQKIAPMKEAFSKNLTQLRTKHIKRTRQSRRAEPKAAPKSTAASRRAERYTERYTEKDDEDYEPPMYSYTPKKSKKDKKKEKEKEQKIKKEKYNKTKTKKVTPPADVPPTPILNMEMPKSGEKFTTLNISLPHNIAGVAEKGKQLFKTLSIALPPHVMVENQPEITIQRKSGASKRSAPGGANQHDIKVPRVDFSK